jgi:hypothetical protein
MSFRNSFATRGLSLSATFMAASTVIEDAIHRKNHGVHQATRIFDMALSSWWMAISRSM